MASNKKMLGPEHLTPSDWRRVTGTTLDAEYLSDELHVRFIVRCSSRCCCSPYFAAHTTHRFASPRPHATCALFHTLRACAPRADLAALELVLVDRRGEIRCRCG